MISINGALAYSIFLETVNSELYCNILNDYVVQYFKRHLTSWFQKDGAPAHYITAAREILDNNLAGHLIDRRGEIEWPDRSPDLTTCDYWYWGYIKHLVYDSERPKMLEELEAKIKYSIELTIPLHLHKPAIKSFQKRCNACIDCQGKHLNKILTKNVHFYIEFNIFVPVFIRCKHSLVI